MTSCIMEVLVIEIFSDSLALINLVVWALFNVEIQFFILVLKSPDILISIGHWPKCQGDTNTNNI